MRFAFIIAGFFLTLSFFSSDSSFAEQSMIKMQSETLTFTGLGATAKRATGLPQAIKMQSETLTFTGLGATAKRATGFPQAIKLQSDTLTFTGLGSPRRASERVSENKAERVSEDAAQFSDDLWERLEHQANPTVDDNSNNRGRTEARDLKRGKPERGGTERPRTPENRDLKPEDNETAKRSPTQPDETE